MRDININLPHAGSRNKLLIFLTLNKCFGYFTSVPVQLCCMARFSLIFPSTFCVVYDVLFVNVKNQLKINLPATARPMKLPQTYSL